MRARSQGGELFQEFQGLEEQVAGATVPGALELRKCVAAFRMRVLAYDPYVLPSKAEAVGAIWVNNLGLS